MKNLKVYFHPIHPTYHNDPASCREESKEYLICFLTSQNLRSLVFSDKIWTRLLVPKDNSTFSQQIQETINKNNIKGGLFATPFANLKFKPDFSEKLDKDYKGNALLIKDPNQVEKLTGTNIIDIKNQHQPYQITFKVVSQHKEGYGYGDNKRLSYEESFSQYGSYEHILEVEPLDLGIEDLPPITHLLFSFADETNPLATGNYELTKCELYKSPILTNSVGKTFTMKVEELKIDSNSNTLYFGTNYEYVFGSLTEKKSQDNPQKPTKNPPKNDNSSTQPEPHNSGAFKIVLIVSGIVVGLSFLAFVFYHYSKKKKKNSPTSLKVLNQRTRRINKHYSNK